MLPDYSIFKYIYIYIFGHIWPQYFPISNCDFSHENVGELYSLYLEGAGRLMTTAEETLWLPRSQVAEATQLLPGSLGMFTLEHGCPTNSMKMHC